MDQARIDALAAALQHGQERGAVRPELDAEAVAAFVVAAVEGSIGLATEAGSPALLKSNLAILDAFLESLRVETLVSA